MKHKELRHGAEHDSIEEHNSGLLVRTLGVGMGGFKGTWDTGCEMKQLTTTVGVAMSAFTGEHNPDIEPKDIELVMMQVSRSRWKATPALNGSHRCKVATDKQLVQYLRVLK